MTDAERLLAIEEIKALTARRIRAMDTKDWAEYDTCHAPDATLDSFGTLPEQHKPAGAIARGKKQILEMIKKVVDGKVKLTTVHHAQTPEIELTSPVTAKGIWAMEDLLWWQNGDVLEHLHGWGHYHETYCKIDGRWFIQSRVLTRLRVDQTPGFQSYYGK
jgi:SnoaL-like domain